MKIAVCITCFLMFGLAVSGQQLEGSWSGHFLFMNVSFTKTEIHITINRINDTVIEGFSTTIIKNDTSVCILKGGFIRKKKLYLEETAYSKNFSDTSKNGCLQRFVLFYRENKKNTTLHGDYTTKTCGGGTIFLTKRL